MCVRILCLNIQLCICVCIHQQCHTTLRLPQAMQHCWDGGGALQLLSHIPFK